MKQINHFLLTRDEKGAIQVNSIFSLFLITLLGTFVAIKIVEIVDVSAKTSDNTFCHAGYQYDATYDYCYKHKVIKVEDILKCNSNYTYQSDGNFKGKCILYKKIPNKVRYTCPSGYTLKNQQCISSNTTMEAIVSHSCKRGNNYYSIDGECYEVIIENPVNTNTCPKGYQQNGQYCMKKEITNKK